MACPLCHHQNTSLFANDKARSYQICHQCDLVFVPKKFHLSPEKEKQRYLHHHHELDNQSYKDYQHEFIQQMSPYWKQAQGRMLDYGSGDFSFIQKSLIENGYKVDLFDLYFHPDQTFLNNDYDIIWMSEVWEHLNDPSKVMNWIKSHLKPSGYFLVRTSLRCEDDQFPNWYYKRDQTHIIFPSQKTLQWMAEAFNFKIIKIQNPFWVFQQESL